MEPILTERRDGILRIEFNRPEKKNAITAAMYAVIADALTGAERDAGVRVILLHGNFAGFTAGNDLQDFLANPPRNEHAPAFRFLAAMRDASKPVIAALSGPAVGVGTTMLFHCDLIYAAPDTRFSLPFVNLALCPEAGSSYLLPRLAGYQRAAELLLLGEPFSAERAREIGLVNEIVPSESLLEHALGVARKLVAKPAAALRVTKSLMKQAIAERVCSVMAVETTAFGVRLDSPEAKEAFTAFLEKRQPDFSKFA
jgi:enoyl-CoA hydratase/carnithine racemase